MSIDNNDMFSFKFLYPLRESIYNLCTLFISLLEFLVSFFLNTVQNNELKWLVNFIFHKEQFYYFTKRDFPYNIKMMFNVLAWQLANYATVIKYYKVNPKLILSRTIS